MNSNFNESFQTNSAKRDAGNSDIIFTSNTTTHTAKLTYSTLSQKDLKQYSNQELTQRLEKLVRTERKITNLVLLHIAELEERKVYADLGYDGMYSYLTRGLGYSEGSAYRRLQAARLLKQLPTVADKVESGAINLSQLTLLQKSIKVTTQRGEAVSQEKALDVLSKLENQNTFETQKTLALEMNLPVQVHEKIKPQQDDSVRLEVTLSKKQFAELEQAKSLLSHVCSEGSWADVIAVLAKGFNQRKLGKGSSVNPHSVNVNSKQVLSEIAGSDIVESELLDTSAINSEAPRKDSIKFEPEGSKCFIYPTPITTNSPSECGPPEYRRYISVHHKRSLLKRANYCCEYKDRTTGKRCTSKYQLEVDHLRPLALGGTDDLQNLRILCRTHNALAARRAGVLFSRDLKNARSFSKRRTSNKTMGD